MCKCCLPSLKDDSVSHWSLLVTDIKERVIYLHGGTNDVKLGYNGGPGYNGGSGKKVVLDSMADLLFTCRTNFTKAKVFLNNILLRRGVSQKALLDLNDQLELMCGNFGVAFVQSAGCVRKRHLARDGRHLNRNENYRLGRLMLSKLLEMDEMRNVGVNSSLLLCRKT
ncbi:hypothetical protein J6590_065336 [Homalodisca vitripennis]|nr:hypothetical protein J6590_065336 [Homalodisca vitripennis]